jgi:hypothetical protein
MWYGWGGALREALVRSGVVDVRTMKSKTRGEIEMAKKLAEGQFLTPVFRASYPNLFTPRAAQAGAELKYSLTMIFPKVMTDPTEKALMDALKAAVAKAAVDKWGPDKAKWPTKKLDLGNGEFRVVSAINSPWHDGVEKDQPGYGADVVYAAASAKAAYKPGLVNAQNQDIIQPNEFYAGCYARAIVTVFAYSNQRLGVSFGLRAVQKVRDGEPMGGSVNAADVFDAIQAPAGAPAGAAGSAAGAAAGAGDPFGI